jgi:hypothetical protein
LLDASATVPTVNGEFRYVTGVGFRFYEEGVEKGLTGTGISEPQHKTLLQLIHFIDEGPAEGFTSGATKTVTGGLFPTLIQWKRQDATLLVEKIITRSGGGATAVKPTPIVWKVYDTDGSTVLATVSDAITYSGIAEVSRVRTIS